MATYLPLTRRPDNEHDACRQNLRMAQNLRPFWQSGWLSAAKTDLSATLKQEPSGHWNVTFVSHLELPDAPPTCENPVGIDVGLASFLTLDSGEKVKPPKFYRKGECKLRRAQRKLSRCKKNSHNRQQAKKRAALCHARVRNQRNDWLHKLSCRLVRLYDTLCVEDLNLKGLMRTKLAKSFSDAAISTFLIRESRNADGGNVRLAKVSNSC